MDGSGLKLTRSLLGRRLSMNSDPPAVCPRSDLVGLGLSWLVERSLVGGEQIKGGVES